MNARSTVQTEQAMNLFVKVMGPGRPMSGNRLQFEHICGTVVWFMRSFFLTPYKKTQLLRRPSGYENIFLFS